MVRLAALRSLSLVFVGRNMPFLEHYAEDITIEARDIDHALAAWARAAPEDWKYSSQPCPSFTDKSELQPPDDLPVHSYPDHGHATIWNRYRAVRLIVNSIRIWALSILIRHPSQLSFVTIHQEASGVCQKNICNLADDLCASMPFFFNAPAADGGPSSSGSIVTGKRTVKVDGEILPKLAGLLAWPLTVAVSTEHLPELRGEWLRGRLKTVADSLGDSVLEAVVELGEFRF